VFAVATQEKRFKRNAETSVKIRKNNLGGKLRALHRVIGKEKKTRK